jgi:hypothetical protein
MYIRIVMPDASEVDIAPSPAAREATRFWFNPSGLARVATLKALAAAFITACEETVQDNPACEREIDVAKTSMQTASMWAVLGATKEK